MAEKKESGCGAVIGAVFVLIMLGCWYVSVLDSLAEKGGRVWWHYIVALPVAIWLCLVCFTDATAYLLVPGLAICGMIALFAHGAHPLTVGIGAAVVVVGLIGAGAGARNRAPAVSWNGWCLLVLGLATAIVGGMRWWLF